MRLPTIEGIIKRRVLVAFFDENMVVPDCVVPSIDGLSLHPYKWPALTIKGEVEKLAFNIAMGRNFAGTAIAATPRRVFGWARK